MKIRLTKEEVMKILSTLPTESLEERLESNWEIWKITCDKSFFELNKIIKEK